MCEDGRLNLSVVPYRYGHEAGAYDDAVDRAVMMLHDAPPPLNICYIKYRGGAALCQMRISPCPKAFLMI